jgi:hypothetical protein
MTKTKTMTMTGKIRYMSPPLIGSKAMIYYWLRFFFHALKCIILGVVCKVIF